MASAGPEVLRRHPRSGDGSLGFLERRALDELRLHPEAGLIPDMSESAFDAFVADVRQHGIKTPLEVLVNGTVLDGRNRLRAAVELGLPSVPVRVVDLGGEDSVEFMFRAAYQRRDLTPSQRAAMAVALNGYREKRDANAKAKTDGAKKGGASAGRGRPKPSGNTAGRLSATEKPTAPVRAAARERETRAALAKEAGVSPRTMQKAITLAKRAGDDPEAAALLAKVRSGECSSDEALKKAAAAVTGHGSPDPRVQRRLERDGRIAELHAQHMGATEIAKELGVHVSAVHDAKRRLGLNERDDNPLRGLTQYAIEFADTFDDAISARRWATAKAEHISELVGHLEKLRDITATLIRRLNKEAKGETA